jgi:predicted transposase YdaD
LPAFPLWADLIARLDPHRQAHVEFVHTPARDLLDRMLEYRARILRRDPGQTLDQHILVLADGQVPDRLTDGGRYPFDVTVTYLRDHDPTVFLADPTLAPLAVLARPSSDRPRTTTLREALALITEVSDPKRRHALAETALVLAGIRLDRDTIETITQEARMSFTLAETLAGRQIAAEAQARGQARGTVLGRATVLAALLRRTFGDDDRIEAIATDLAQLPHDEALDLALTAKNLDDLAHRHPHS